MSKNDYLSARAAAIIVVISEMPSYAIDFIDNDNLLAITIGMRVKGVCDEKAACDGHFRLSWGGQDHPSQPNRATIAFESLDGSYRTILAYDSPSTDALNLEVKTTNGGETKSQLFHYKRVSSVPQTPR